MANLSRYDQKELFGAQMMLSSLLDSGDLCATIRDEITPLIKDSDFGDMYKEGGRPPVSPRILVLTSIMQYIERLSDRAAVKNLKFRLDWKIAFELPLEFAGFHPTTLVYFRNRLLENQKATFAFDKVIEHLKNCGVIRARGKQRIDSTHIIGCVQKLSRIELFHETLRLFCQEVACYKHVMDEELVRWVDNYLHEVNTQGISDEERDRLIVAAGQAMQGFLEWAEREQGPKEVKGLKSYQTMKQVFDQNFEVVDGPEPGPGSGPKLRKVATGKDHICSPHEVDARYSSKGGKGWLGYKGEVVETVTGSQDEVNFITHIDIIEATDFDGDSLVEIVEDLQEKGIAPSELYGDTHYNTAANIEEAAKRGVTVEGPVKKNSNRVKEKNKGFKIDLEQKKAICPQGIESIKFNEKKPDNVYAKFPKNSCADCDRKSICEPELRGKRIEMKRPNPILEQRRKQMKDPGYNRDLHKRNGIEGTLSGLVRGQSWRRSRYRGKDKSQLQAKFTGAAANIIRLHRKRQFDKNETQKQAS